MKDQDLREKFKPYAHGTDVIDNIAHTDNNIWNNSTDQCVQIALDYAREEAIGFLEWKDKLYVEQKTGLFDLGNGIININELKKKLAFPNSTKYI